MFRRKTRTTLSALKIVASWACTDVWEQEWPNWKKKRYTACEIFSYHSGAN